MLHGNSWWNILSTIHYLINPSLKENISILLVKVNKMRFSRGEKFIVFFPHDYFLQFLHLNQFTGILGSPRSQHSGVNRKSLQKYSDLDLGPSSGILNRQSIILL